jgi:hypothetical protein
MIAVTGKNPKGISSFSPALTDAIVATLGGESQNDLNSEGVESLRAKPRCNRVAVRKYWETVDCRAVYR